MNNRPYVLLSCAISLDGYLDDASPDRLVLSNDGDLDRMHGVRAGVDAIMVGANTIRRDDPRLVVRGTDDGPVKVTVTASGDLDREARFFTVGSAPKLVYAPDGVADSLVGVATVIECGSSVDLEGVLDDLGRRGVRRLMVEGGATILTQFLASGLASEWHLAVAPLLVGDPRAPRFVHNGQFGGPMVLAELRPIGEVVLLRYLLGQAARDWRWLRAAVALSRSCPPSTTAFSVGAIIVDESGAELARGYSRETDPLSHAEEVALSTVDPADPRLRSATIYSSLEPCGKRASRPRSCAELIIAAGIPRVVFALREPGTFVAGEGAERLANAGVEVVEMEELADGVREVNAHLS